MLYVPPIVQGAIHTHKLISDQASITASEYHIDLIGNILTANKTEYLTGLFVAQLEAALKSNKVDLNARTVVRGDILQALKAAVLTFRKRLVFDRIAKFAKEYKNEYDLVKYEKIVSQGFVEEILLDLDGTGYNNLTNSMRSLFLHGTVETNDPFVPRKFRRDQGIREHVNACKLLLDLRPEVPLVTNRRFDALNVALPEPIEYINIQPYYQSQPNTALSQVKTEDMSFKQPTSLAEASVLRVQLIGLITRTATTGTAAAKESANKLLGIVGVDLFNENNGNPDFFLASLEKWSEIDAAIKSVKDAAPKNDGLSLPVLLQATPSKSSWAAIIAFLDKSPKTTVAIENDDVAKKMYQKALDKAKSEDFNSAFVLLGAVIKKVGA